jgi:hypothetical protein
MIKNLVLSVLLIVFATGWCFGQSLTTYFTDDPTNGSSIAWAQADGAQDERIGDNDIVYQCFSSPSGTPTFVFNGTTTSGTFANGHAQVSHALATNGATGNAYFPYTYDAGSVLCGGPRYATLVVPVVVKGVVTRVSFANYSCSINNLGCGGNAGCTYSNFTPRCNGGTLNPDFIPKTYLGDPGKENICGMSTKPTGLWGLDETSFCVYKNPTDATHPHPPYVCLHNPSGGALARANVTNPPTPLYTSGPCTLNGVTH